MALAHFIGRMSERIAKIREDSACHKQDKEERKAMSDSLMRELRYYNRVTCVLKTVDRTFEVSILRLWLSLAVLIVGRWLC